MLSTPSKELAGRIVSEVDFEQRIEGFRLRERTGIIPVTMYSFTEVTLFLSDPYPRIDFTSLANWIRGIMKDDELADKIENEIEADRSDHDKASRVRDLMAIRLVQCKKRG